MPVNCIRAVEIEHNKEANRSLRETILFKLRIERVEGSETKHWLPMKLSQAFYLTKQGI